MIAAKDPQEFIPSGRQQLLRHPGPSELYNGNEGETNFASEFLLNQFQKVSITETKNSEWWMVRKSPGTYKKCSVTVEEKAKCNKSCLGIDINSCSQPDALDNSWTWKSTENSNSIPKISKQLDQQVYKNRNTMDCDLVTDSLKTTTVNKNISTTDGLKCKTIGIMEEELYIKDNVVIWSIGLVSSGNTLHFDNSRVTKCSFTSNYPIKHAQWCTFYSELPSFNNKENICTNVFKSTGTPLPSICIIDDQNLQVYTVNGEDFVTTLPFNVRGLWTTKFGILLEKEKKSNLAQKLQEEEETQPTVFSMTHPLDEVSPVAIRQGSLRLIDDYAVNIVYTSENPSICMLYDKHTSQHSVYYIRKVKTDEWVEISEKVASPSPSLHSLSNRLKSRLTLWDFKNTIGQMTPSPFRTRPNSAVNAHSHSQQQSRSHSPMAAISRCQSPTISPLIGSNPWLPPTSRLHSSFRFPNSNTNVTNNTCLEINENYHHVNPLFFLYHVWTDTFALHLDGTGNGAASKVFLIDDLVGRSYLCYLVPSRLQLSIVRVDIFDTNTLAFGILTSISAKDAVPIPHLHMFAILEHSGSVVLYSGLTMVGKLHIGGVLAQHTPSPCVMRNLPQFNSPFPRRSTLVPNYGTPISDPHFDEHLLSPVLPVFPTNRNFTTNLLTLDHPYKTTDDPNKTQLSGLRDPIEDRITLQYSDGTYYRITLPTLASSTLVEDCLNALKQTLQSDFVITLFTRWYATRNAPGPNDLSLEQEWEMLTSLILELLGYDNEQSSDPHVNPLTPSTAAKRQRRSSIGNDSDWHLMLNFKEKHNFKDLCHILNLEIKNFRPANLLNDLEVQININSLLFPCIRIIHFSLHLLYEEIKLNAIRIGELPYLAKFLSKLASDLRLKDYVSHYWKDFPDHCYINYYKIRSISETNLKNVIIWPIMQDKAENIMEHIYLLLQGQDLAPYPYISHINTRSKNIIQLSGLFIKGNMNEEVEIESFITHASQSNVGSKEFSTPKSTIINTSQSISEKVVMLMIQMGISSRELDSFPAGINLLLYDALWQCREHPPHDWPTDAYSLLQRTDLVLQSTLFKQEASEANMKKHLTTYDNTFLHEALPTLKQADDVEHEDGMEGIDTALLKLRFPKDHRISETRRLLQSSKPITIGLLQRPDISDHDFIEEQEKHLYAVCARTMSLPVGRGMFTLRIATPVVTEPLPLPKLCLTGKAPPRGNTIELTHIDYPQNMQHWPLFHNGVANGLRISPDAHNIDSPWILFNKPKNSVETNMEHAGFLMALGLNGHLTNLTIVNTFNYLSKANEMTSIGILLGLSAAMRGTLNTVVTKMLSVHLEALLPPTSMELDVPHNLQVAALLGVGLVYQGSAHRHITEVLLAEIGRPPGPEMENSTDRESYSLAAGLALGLVTLQQGGRPSGLSDLNVPDTLHYYMVGGNKRSLEGSQKEKYKVPSFQIREGTTVNLDITAPGATLALGLMFLQSGNKAIADWMAPPETQYLLDFIRPDFLMLRILSRGLILWDDIRPDREWIENQVPESFRRHCLVKPTELPTNIDYEAMNQAYCNIVAGACFAMGLKYAGSGSNEAFSALLHFCHMFTSLTGKSIAELAGKPTIETCLNIILLSAGMVMAGTGSLEVMRIVRHLRRRVSLNSSAAVTYGSHLAVHMALGLLFLGGGRYTLSNSPASVAALICAFYPKFPNHSSDNRYHLQAFRHLYVLAVEPRLLVPKDVATCQICYAKLKVVYLNGDMKCMVAPCIIPDLNTLYKVTVEDERYWPIEFERGRNWDQLLKLLSSCGFVKVKQRAGCLSYTEDKLGYRTELARTLTHSKTVPWDPPPKAITTFSTDYTIKHFTDNFLTTDSTINSSNTESRFLKLLTKTTYECVIKDKEAILSNLITLMQLIQDPSIIPTAFQLWQFKIICSQVLNNPASAKLISFEVMLALKQELAHRIESWENSIENLLKSYISGETIGAAGDNIKQLISYIIFYDIPFNIHSELRQNNLTYINFVLYLHSKNYATTTIEKITKILDIIP